MGGGVGGSSLWLARKLNCWILGLTISPVQAAMATEMADAEALSDRGRFEVSDANHLDLGPKSFDVVWVVECSEHLADKARFADYAGWMRQSGLERIKAEDITRHVRKTWTRCAALARRKEVRALLKVNDERTRRFVESFSAIQQAYEVDAMADGMFTARRLVSERARK